MLIALRGKEKMNMFNNAMEQVSTEKRTLNNAKAYSSSLSKCLDLFFLGGSIRDWSHPKIRTLFTEAYEEDPIIATKIALYIRDVREGMGERKIGRMFLHALASEYNYREDPMILKIIDHIADIGRWDDLVHIFYCTINENLKNEISRIIIRKIKEDINSDRPSLLAKWLPSINAGRLSRKKAIEVMKYTGISNEVYRKILTELRKKIDIVETKITQENFKDIEYAKIPSQAILRYKRIFFKKDTERFKNHIELVKKKKTKMNASTLYPYQLVKPFFENSINRDKLPDNEVNFYNTMWDILPDYTKAGKAIVVADTSGSMFLDPMCISVSLAIYFAERNTGPFKDKFITFSHSPKFQTLRGRTLYDKLINLDTSGWSNNTDITKTFRLILETGIKYSVPQEDMPEVLYIISDMEFDAAIDATSNSYYGMHNITLEPTNFEAIKEMYEQFGYEMPMLVFWNVNAKSSTIPVRYNEHGTALVSGKSASTFSLAVEGNSPQEFMLEAIKDKYKFVE